MRGLEVGVRCRLRIGYWTEDLKLNDAGGGMFCWKAFVPELGKNEYWYRDGFYDEETVSDLDIVEILP